MGKRPLSEAASGCRGGPFWTLRSGLYTYNVSSASARLRIHISVTACTDDGTCRLGHRVNPSLTSAKASHNPSAPIAYCWHPSGEALVRGMATLEVRDEEWRASGLPTLDPAQVFTANGSHINTG